MAAEAGRRFRGGACQWHCRRRGTQWKARRRRSRRWRRETGPTAKEQTVRRTQPPARGGIAGRIAAGGASGGRQFLVSSFRLRIGGARVASHFIRLWQGIRDLGLGEIRSYGWLDDSYKEGVSYLEVNV